MSSKELNEKQKIFCREYIFDWNQTRAYLKAYPDCKEYHSAGVSAHKLLKITKISEYITKIQDQDEKNAGISRLKIILEHKKIAFSSIAHLHDTWIDRKEFDNLTDEQKDCIETIDTKIIKKVFNEFNSDTNEFDKVPYNIEHIKIKLYDKQKSLDSICKMLGYNEPDKFEHSGKIDIEQITGINVK